VTSTSTETFPDMANVQGNGLAGFLKDYQRFLFFRVGNTTAARAWVGRAAGDIVSTAQGVRAFNDAYKVLKHKDDPARIAATWACVAFSFAGLRALDVPQTDLAGFEDAFKDNILTRATTPAIGDTGESAPANWETLYSHPEDLHMCVIVASDDPGLLDRESERIIASALRDSAFALLGIEEGAVRADAPGREHFGYKDGISQPRPRVASADAPSTDGTSAWDFVVNGQQPSAPPPTSTRPSNVAYPQPTSPLPAPIQPPLPLPWMHEGSYVVFRKLAQRVKDFDDYVQSQAAAAGVQPDIFGARLVGRYKNGFPLAKLSGLPTYDPTAGSPSLPYDESEINDFTYDADLQGNLMPKAAHIQKSNPRFGSTSRPRIMRRGIPYGIPFQHDADQNDPAGAATERGLLFVCYQAWLAAQFEVINEQWVNAPDFGDPGDGVDPLIGQLSGQTQCPFRMTTQGTSNTLTVPRFVTTRGTVYLFQPSLSGLKHIAGFNS